MKSLPMFVAFVVSLLTATQAPAQQAAAYRRFTTRDGKAFSAAIVARNDASVTFKLPNGATMIRPIRDQSFEYRLAGNHILIDGTVGSSKSTFLIDTGAHGGVLNLDFSKRASLEMGPMDQVIAGIAGTAPAAITKVPALRLGEVLVEGRDLLSADIYKDMPIVGGRGDYDAIFGADFLRELDAVINYKEARMFLRPDASDKPDAPAKSDTPAKLNASGKPDAAAKVDAPK